MDLSLSEQIPAARLMLPPLLPRPVLRGQLLGAAKMSHGDFYRFASPIHGSRAWCTDVDSAHREFATVSCLSSSPGKSVRTRGISSDNAFTPSRKSLFLKQFLGNNVFQERSLST